MGDLKAALQVLGLEDDAELTRAAVKRAYLRKLRDHPPERDPDGFRALREAFERVDATLPGSPAGPVAIVTELEPASAPPTAIVEPTLDDRTHQILELLGSGDVDDARALARDQPDEVRDRAATIRWARTRELLAIAVVLPAELLVALARAIAADDVSSARPAFEAYHQDRPAQARDLLAHMSRRARSLYQAVRPVHRAVEIKHDRGRLLWIIGAIAVLSIARFVVHTGEHERAADPPAQIDLGDTMYRRIAGLADSLRRDPAATPGQVAAAAELAAAATEHASCARLTAPLPAIHDGPAALASMVGSIDSVMRFLCPEPVVR